MLNRKQFLCSIKFHTLFRKAAIFFYWSPPPNPLPRPSCIDSLSGSTTKTLLLVRPLRTLLGVSHPFMNFLPWTLSYQVKKQIGKVESQHVVKELINAWHILGNFQANACNDFLMEGTKIISKFFRWFNFVLNF